MYTGSTAELLSMWAIMMAGPNPFILDNKSGILQLKLTPILPSWLFTDVGTVTFTFLGSVRVTYHNPQKSNTWQITPKTATVTGIDGFQQVFANGIVEGGAADNVRSGRVAAIDIYY